MPVVEQFDLCSFPAQAIALFIGSIARTNLECDLVQRGGSLVNERAMREAKDAAAAGATGGAAAATSAASSGAGPSGATVHVNKPKSCFSKFHLLRSSNKQQCYVDLKWGFFAVPLMHVLSIHLNAMQPDTLARQWALLCGKADHANVALAQQQQRQQQQQQQQQPPQATSQPPQQQQSQQQQQPVGILLTIFS